MLCFTLYVRVFHLSVLTDMMDGRIGAIRDALDSEGNNIVFICLFYFLECLFSSYFVAPIFHL